MVILWDVPSGKRLRKTVDRSTHFESEDSLNFYEHGFNSYIRNYQRVLFRPRNDKLNRNFDAGISDSGMDFTSEENR